MYTYRACKTLFGPTKPTNPSVRMAYEGQSSFGITAILYIYRAYSGLLNPLIHQSERPMKDRAVLE